MAGRSIANISANNMTTKQYFKQKHLKNEQRFSGVSRHRAKGKSGNSGIHPRNGQIEQVGLETIFNAPSWIKRQYI